MAVTILHMTYQLLCLVQHDIWWSSPMRQAASVADRGRLPKAGMIAQGGLYMQVSISPCVLELVTGDITRQTTDAIINAANSRLAGGGGVDGAIHRAGGRAIMAETRQRYAQSCPTGDAVITGAGQLPVHFVIHAVGPVWH